MNGKERKKVRTQLERLTRAQLVALAVQKTDVPYQTIMTRSSALLVQDLIEVENILKPVQA
ncbi:MAG: hypothetical protein ACYSW8_26620 [Planctomycetota bacterium]|jgi:hypothetical protein